MFGRPKKTGFELYYHQIIEQIPSVLILCHEDFTVRFVNAAGRNFLAKYLPNYKLNLTSSTQASIDQIIPNFRRNWTERKTPAIGTKPTDAKTNLSALLSSSNQMMTGEVGGMKCDISVAKCDAMDDNHGHMFAITLMPSTGSDHPSENIDIYALLDNLPHNVMFSDTAGKILFVSKSGLETFQREQHNLPIPVSQIVGSSFDVFHKNPKRVHEIVNNTDHFLHRTKIHLGDQIFDFRATALNDRNGKRMGTIVTWSSFTFAANLSKK